MHPLDDRLPIVVAVTGHHDLVDEQIPEIRAAMRGILTRLRERYAATPIIVVTSARPGAERLAADVANEIPDVHVRYPVAVASDGRTRSRDASDDADDRGPRATDATIRVPYRSALDGDRSDAACGAEEHAAVIAYCARVAHVFIAVWDGKSLEGDTGRAVHLRLNGRPANQLRGARILDDPETGPVYQIVAGRQSDPATLYPAGRLRLRASFDRTIDEAHDPLRTVCKSIDAFNRDLRELDLTHVEADDSIERLRTIASRLAVRFHRRFKTALRALFACAAIAAIALALFAHLREDRDWMLIPYVVATGCALACFTIARRRRWQDRFLEYRTLDMGLRVQRMWDLAGLNLSVAEEYLRRQRSELDWIRDAIRTVHALARRTQADEPCDHDIAFEAIRDFVNAQHDFFDRGTRTNETAHKRYERLADLALKASILLSGALCVAVAYLFRQFHAPGRPETTLLRDVPIFLVALFTIVAALLHEYPQRNAYHAQARRYQAMRDIYARASGAIDEASRMPAKQRIARARAIALLVGREALAENAEWAIIHRELPIELLRV